MHGAFEVGDEEGVHGERVNNALHHPPHPAHRPPLLPRPSSRTPKPVHPQHRRLSRFRHVSSIDSHRLTQPSLGGHTTEALALLSSIDFSRYTPRTYIVSDGDHLSAQKAAALESSKTSSVCLHSQIVCPSTTIPPGNRQPIFHPNSPPRSAYSPIPLGLPSYRSVLPCRYHLPPRARSRHLSQPQPHLTRRPFAQRPWHMLYHMHRRLSQESESCTIFRPHVLEHPQFLGLHSPRIIYIESFARVKSLSLSGKLIRRWADRQVHITIYISISLSPRFVVQWPQLLQDKGRGECHGWLV